MKNFVKKLFLLVIKSFYYRKCSKQTLERFSLSMLFAMGFAQRILGINKDSLWPVHWSSIVNCPEKIYRKWEASTPGIMPGQYIQAMNGITIGYNVRMAPGVKIISANHDLIDYDIHLKEKEIIIGDNCWLGANAILLPGVKLANHVIVAAGAVVTKSFQENDIIIAGVPAKKIKKIDIYLGATHGKE